MIQETELRLNNYVYAPNGKKTKVGYEVIRALVILNPKPNYKAIELKEDILLKCGFDVESKEAYSTCERVDFNIYRNKRLTYNSLQNQWWIDSSITVSIIYLHQLQNLYFALTNQELTINL